LGEVLPRHGRDDKLHEVTNATAAFSWDANVAGLCGCVFVVTGRQVDSQPGMAALACPVPRASMCLS